MKTIGLERTLVYWVPRLAAVSFFALSTMPGVATEASSFTIYADDPEHLWNRLHRTLFGREWRDGTVYGLDDTQLLYWRTTDHLTTGDSHAAGIAVLDEFLDKNGEALIEDPLERAMLQLDLWALFDWTARGRLKKLSENQLRLQKRLVAVMKRIALTRDQIEALPDNYSLAVESGAFPSEVNTEKHGAPYLPPNLLDEESGPWVRIYGAGGEQGAEAHVRHADGRSLFWVYLRVPEGRDATWDYIMELRDFERPFEAVSLDREANQPVYSWSYSVVTGQTNITESSELPQLPPGTQAALVEQAMLIDDSGNITPTPLTVHVQIRAHGGPLDNYAPSFFELRLHRRALFHGRAGGFVAMGDEDEVFPGFGFHDVDAFETTSRLSRVQALRCTGCHQQTGVYTFFSRHRIIGLPGRSMPQQGLRRNTSNKLVSRDNPLPRMYEENDAVYWKKRQYSWGRLEALWMTVE